MVDNQVRVDRRALLREALDVLESSDPDGYRQAVHASEDAEILALCARIGFGAVMDSAARQWRARDGDGAITTGACVCTVQKTVARLRAALGRAR